MEEKAVLWTVIVALLIIALLVKTFIELNKNKRRNVISLASDEEMFYCPGDCNEKIEDETV